MSRVPFVPALLTRPDDDDKGARTINGVFEKDEISYRPGLFDTGYVYTSAQGLIGLRGLDTLTYGDVDGTSGTWGDLLVIDGDDISGAPEIFWNPGTTYQPDDTTNHNEQNWTATEENTGVEPGGGGDSPWIPTPPVTGPIIWEYLPGRSNHVVGTYYGAYTPADTFFVGGRVQYISGTTVQIGTPTTEGITWTNSPQTGGLAVTPMCSVGSVVVGYINTSGFYLPVPPYSYIAPPAGSGFMVYGRSISSFYGSSSYDTEIPGSFTHDWTGAPDPHPDEDSRVTVWGNYYASATSLGSNFVVGTGSGASIRFLSLSPTSFDTYTYHAISNLDTSKVNMTFPPLELNGKLVYLPNTPSYTAVYTSSDLVTWTQSTADWGMTALLGWSSPTPLLAISIGTRIILMFQSSTSTQPKTVYTKDAVTWTLLNTEDETMVLGEHSVGYRIVADATYIYRLHCLWSDPPSFGRYGVRRLKRSHLV